MPSGHTSTKVLTANIQHLQLKVNRYLKVFSFLKRVDHLYIMRLVLKIILNKGSLDPSSIRKLAIQQPLIYCYFAGIP